MPIAATHRRPLPTRAALAAGAALVLLAGAAAPSSAAAADQVLGSVAPAYSGGCGACTTLQQQSAPGSPSYVVASAGVLTSWSFRSSSAGPSSARLRIFRAGTTAGTWTETVQSEFHTSAAGAAEKIPARIPVAAGDHLGLRTGTDGAAGGWVAVLGDKTASAVGMDPQPGESFPGSDTDGHRVNVAAVVEPDADGDGFGDTSQDQCATDPTTQKACPVVAAPPAAVDPTTPATPGPPAPPAEQTPQESPVAPFDGVAIAPGALPVRRGRVTLTVRCPAAARGTCVGRAKLATTIASNAVKLGSAVFSIPAGKSVRVSIAVPRGRRALLGHRGLKLRVAVTAHDPRGIAVTTTAVRSRKA